MGGRVGLKGTDGEEIQRRCRELGAEPEAPGRTVEALKQLEAIREDLEILTYPFEMGEEEARAAGFQPSVMGSVERGNTTAGDTRRAAEDLLGRGAELILFAGGDGTARDICSAVSVKIAALGIPAGVKIHSAVFGTTPRAAGLLALRYFEGRARQLKQAEVMDIDEQAFRLGRVSAALYGYLSIPYEQDLVQSMKAGRIGSEEAELQAISSYVQEQMEPDTLYIMGPGTTMRAIKNRIDPENTLLGVDVVQNGRIVARDAGEQTLLRLIEGNPARIVVTVIGGQGYIFGRGNQQISPRVIRKTGRENIVVVASKMKIAALAGRPLLVDTGDEETDRLLAGYMRVVAGYRELYMFRVSA